MTSCFYKEPEFDTLQLYAGHEPERSLNARAVPVYASTSFCFDSTQSQGLFGVNSGSDGFVYSRISNPTVDVFEKRIAALEGGMSAIATASGMSAQFVALLTLASAGDNIVPSSFLYGGSQNQLKVIFKKFGIQVRFVGTGKVEDYAVLIDGKTKAIYTESISNPTFLVAPIKELAELAHNHHLPLVVDNTLGMGGYLFRPIDCGADIVVQSATKWIGGHGTTIAGVLVDSGHFNWKAASDRFPSFNTPSEGFHNVIYADLGDGKAFSAKARSEMLRDMGPALNPFAAFLLLQGVETLSLRAERHCENAMQLAKFLDAHPKVSWVSYLGLNSHPSHFRAKSLLRPGLFGGLLCFGVKGGAEASKVFINNLRLASHLANIGDAKTLVIQPAATTHIQSSDEEQLSTGVTSDLIRVSVGIEAISDIIADFEGALNVL
ncbi:O-acetylhomoserine ami [Armillaria fumosa]|nr:O-acetylhomoserine ami [Armillaria fumosa]